MLPAALLLPLLTLALRPGPAPEAASQPPARGLRAEYYAGRNFDKLLLTRTDPAINFVWSQRGQPRGNRFVMTPPGPDLPTEDFSVRWTGHLHPPESGTYTLQASVDDGMRVWLGELLVIDAWRNQPATAYDVDIELQAGATYALKVEYYQARFEAEAILAWRLPSATESANPQPIISAYYTPPPALRPKPLRPAPVAAAEQAAPILAVTTEDPAEDPTQLPAPGPLPSRLRPGMRFSISNVFAPVAPMQPAPTALRTLAQLARVLKAQPELHLQLAGQGAFATAQAKAVRQYLIRAGTPPGQLSLDAAPAAQAPQGSVSIRVR